MVQYQGVKTILFSGLMATCFTMFSPAPREAEARHRSRCCRDWDYERDCDFDRIRRRRRVCCGVVNYQPACCPTYATGYRGVPNTAPYRMAPGGYAYPGNAVAPPPPTYAPQPGEANYPPYGAPGAVPTPAERQPGVRGRFEGDVNGEFQGTRPRRAPSQDQETFNARPNDRGATAPDIQNQNQNQNQNQIQNQNQNQNNSTSPETPEIPRTNNQNLDEPGSSPAGQNATGT